MSNVSIKSIALALPLSASLVSSPVAAQELEEIIVTAQKRAESLQDTALSVVALSANDLEVRQIKSLRDLVVNLPSLQFYDFPTTTNNVAMFMRGLGNTDSQTLTLDNPIGVYIDGIYMARTSGSTIDVLDLERIEVLRGPQGTLYGRNSSSGAINFISAKPAEEFGGRFQVGAGNFGAWNVGASLDLPLSDTFRAKFSALKSNFDGWVENSGPNDNGVDPTNDYYFKEQGAVRVALQWTPSDAVTVDYAYDSSDIDSTPMYYQTQLLKRAEQTTNANVPLPEFAYTVPLSTNENLGHALTITWDLNDTMTFKSVTGYREMEEEVYQSWPDSLFFGTNLDWETEQFSQELQLSSDGEAFDWIAGLYYFEEDGSKSEEQFLGFVQDFVPPFGPPLFALDPLLPALAGLPANFVDPNSGGTSLGTTNFSTNLTSLAAYLQATFSLSSIIDVTAGVRYTEDERDATRNGTNSFQPGTNNLDYSRVDWNVTLDVQATENTSAYLRVATGYRAGGSSERDIDFSRTFDEESLIAYELGLKSQFWDNRARFNAAVFMSDYDDFITTLGGLDPQFAATIETVNVGDVKIAGAEADLTIRIAERTAFSASYTYLDTELKNFVVPQDSFLKSPVANFGQDFRGQDISGDIRLVQAPRHAMTFTIDQGFALKNGAEINWHTDWVYREAVNSNPSTGNKVPELGVLNMRLSLDEMKWGDRATASIGLWVKNLSNEEKEVYIIGAPEILQGRQFNEPRTTGVDLRIDF